MDLKVLECRIDPVKKTQYSIKEKGNSTVKTKKEKEYDYYICDYCKERIVVTKKQEDRTGGIMSVPITSSKSLNLALCCKCLKPALKEINNHYRTNF